MVKAYCDLVEKQSGPTATLYKRVGVAKRHVERLKVFSLRGDLGVALLPFGCQVLNREGHNARNCSASFGGQLEAIVAKNLNSYKRNRCRKTSDGNFRCWRPTCGLRRLCRGYS